MRKLVKKGLVCLFIMGCICGSLAFTKDVAVAKTRKVIEKQTVSDFLNDYFNKNRKKYGVPGVAVSVVKDGKELTTAYYGDADREKKIEVTKQTTFPACSVSKLFTATAIMQLQEQGKIDLTKDIRAYVPDLTIKNLDGRKITCSQLLTHTSGLDEQSELNGSTLNSKEIKSQKAYFTTHIPTVIHEPGTVSCYSNMGYNILGYIVERVSGQSYEDYVKNNILKPLEMKDSSVRLGNSHKAVGYVGENGNYEKQGFAYQYTSGSSGIIATVKDMENFMLMHLNHGKFKDKEVLHRATANLMQQKEFANNNIFDGMGYGWIRTSYDNINVLKHEGALPGYVTTMFLIPQENMGIYIATNSTTGICFDFEEAFMKHFYGKDAIEGSKDAYLPVKAKGTKDLSVYTGTYRSYDGIARKNLMKLGILFDDTDMKVSKQGKDRLLITYVDQKKQCIKTTVRYCGNDVFVRDDGRGYVTFGSQGKSNKISYAFTQVSHTTYEKIKPYETKGVLLLGCCTFVLLFVSTVFLLIQLVRRKQQNKRERWEKLALIIGQGLTFLMTVVGIGMVMDMIYSYDYSQMSILRVLFGSQVFGVVLMLGSSIENIYQKIKLHSSKVAIARSMVLLGIQVVAVMVLNYFNLLGGRL